MEYTFVDSLPSSYCTRAGASQWETTISVLVDGMPPVPGATGPGVTVYANTQEEAMLLRELVLRALRAAGLAA